MRTEGYIYAFRKDVNMSIVLGFIRDLTRVFITPKFMFVLAII